MSEPSLKEQYRELLSGLNRAVERREENEAIYREALTVEDRPRHGDLQIQVQNLQEAFQASREYAVELYQQQAQKVEDRFVIQSQGVEREARDAAAAIRGEYQQATEQTEDTYQQNRWLMSSLVDDQAEESPKRKLENLRDRINQSDLRVELDSQGLDDLYQKALAILQQRGVTCEIPPVERVAPTRTSLETQQRFTDAEQAAQLHFLTLSRQYGAYLLSSVRLLVLVFLLWLGIGAGGFFGLDRSLIGLGDLSDETWLIACGIVGGVAGLLFGLFGWLYSRSKTFRGFEAFFQSFSVAKQYRQLYTSLSERELADAELQYEKYEKQLVQHREKSLQRFSDERKLTAEQLKERRDEMLAQVAADREAKLAPLISDRERHLGILEHNHTAYLQLLEWHHAGELYYADARHRKRLEDYQSTVAEIRRILVEDWQSDCRKLHTEAERISERYAEPDPSWERILSSDWPIPETIPHVIPVGQYHLNLLEAAKLAGNDEALIPQTTELSLPAILPFPGAPSLVVQSPAAGRKDVDVALQTVMLRWLTSLPPGTLRFTIIDSQSLGEPFSAFMHLADYNELLISHRIWTESAQIDRQLADLTEHMENIFQKYLRNEFASIEDYNRTAGEVAEPYRLLVVSGFPHGFSERAAQRLASIAASGPKCGVYLLLGIDTSQPLPRGFDATPLLQNATLLTHDKHGFRNSEFGSPDLNATIDPPPEPAVFSKIVKKLGELSLTTRRVEVAFQRIIPKPEDVWKSDSRRMLDVPLGRAGATKLQHLRLGIGTSQHVLIAGRTGSGKSTLLHVIVTNAALHYSPRELEFYLIDFKKGVEFKAYAEGRLPHARVIAIESDREFGLSALERLDAELKIRGDLFRRENVQDLDGYRNAKPDRHLPRILLVIDEFQEFFVEDDRLAQNATLLLDRLVRQGRAFGIHVLLGSQTLGGAYSLARTTLSQMAVRIALQCSESDAHLILSESNTAARLLNRPGEAIYNDANGLVEGNSPFQISWLDDRERDAALARTRELAQEHEIETPPAIVFEGNIPADLMKNQPLVAQYTGIETESGDDSTGNPILWLGDPVTIGQPTSVELKRHPAGHVLIVGQDDETARGLLAAAMLSASATSTRENRSAKISLFDARAQRSEPSRTWREFLQRLPSDVDVIASEEVRTSLTDLAAEIDRRKSDPATDPPHLVIIDDLSQFRDLRKGDDDFGFGGFGTAKEVSPSQRFAELLKEGPSVGLHFVVWCSSYNNVDRWLGRTLMREFEVRIVMQMNAADSSNLIDSPAANRLGQNRAILYRDDQGTSEKFRPYGFPNENFWQRIADQTVSTKTGSTD